jgi:hypothetical protein
MTDETDVSSPLRLPPELRRDLRKEITLRRARGETASPEGLLLEAWRFFVANRGSSPPPPSTCPICQDAADSGGTLANPDVPAALAELVDEFIRFAMRPAAEDRIWSRHTVELLRERIAERKVRAETTDPPGIQE